MKDIIGGLLVYVSTMDEKKVRWSPEVRESTRNFFKMQALKQNLSDGEYLEWLRKQIENNKLQS
jgi:hypothetical protein